MSVQDFPIVGVDRATSRVSSACAPPSQPRKRGAAYWARTTARWIQRFEAVVAETRVWRSITPEVLLRQRRAVEDSVECVEPPSLSYAPDLACPAPDASAMHDTQHAAYHALASLGAFDTPETGDTEGLPATVGQPEGSEQRAGAACTLEEEGTGCVSSACSMSISLGWAAERAHTHDLPDNPLHSMSDTAGNACAEEGVPPCPGGTPEVFTLWDDDICNWMPHIVGNPDPEEGVHAWACTQEGSILFDDDVCRFL